MKVNKRSGIKTRELLHRKGKKDAVSCYRAADEMVCKSMVAGAMPAVAGR